MIYDKEGYHLACVYWNIRQALVINVAKKSNKIWEDLCRC